MIPDPSKKPKIHAHGHQPGHKLHVPVTVVRANDDGQNLLVQADAGAGDASAMFHVPAAIAVVPPAPPAPPQTAEAAAATDPAPEDSTAPSAPAVAEAACDVPEGCGYAGGD